MAEPASLKDLIKKMNPASGEQIDKLRAENRLILSSIESTDTGLGAEISSQMQEIIKTQNESSLIAIKRSKKQMEKLAEVIEQNQEALGNDYDNLKEAIRRSNEATEFSREKVKQVGSLLGAATKRVGVDLASIAAGVLSDSPILMLATKWIGDSFQGIMESRRKKKEEEEQLQYEIQKRQEEHIKNVQILRAQGLSNEEISQALKLKAENQKIEAQEEQLRSAMEALGVTDEMLERVKNKEQEEVERVDESVSPAQETTGTESPLQEITEILVSDQEQERTLAEENEQREERQQILASESAREDRREAQEHNEELIRVLNNIDENIEDIEKLTEDPNKSGGIFGLMLAALGVGLVAAAGFAQGIVDMFQNLGSWFNNIGRATKWLADIIRGAFSKLGDGIVRIFQIDSLKPIADRFKSVVQGIKNFFDPIVDMGRGLSILATNSIDELLTPFYKGIDGIKNFFRPLANLIDESSVLTKVGDGIATGFSKVVNFTSNIGKWLMGFGSFDISGLPGLGFFAGLSDTFGAIGDKIFSFARGVGRLFAPLMAVIDGVVGFVKGFMEEGLWGGIKGGIQGIAEGFIGGFKFIIADVGGWILDAIGLDSLANAIRDIGDSLMKNLKNLFGGLWEVVEGIFTLDWVKLTGGLQKIWDALAGFIGDTVNAIKTMIINLANKIPGVNIQTEEQERLQEAASKHAEKAAMDLAEKENISIEEAKERLEEKKDNVQDEVEGVDWSNFDSGWLSASHEIEDWDELKGSLDRMSPEAVKEFIETGDTRGDGWDPEDREKLIKYLNDRGSAMNYEPIPVLDKEGNAIPDLEKTETPVIPESNQKGSRPEQAMTYLRDRGWTEEQAAGIVGNLQMESGQKLDEKAVGDNGKAYGIAQWHPDRREKFEEVFGKPMQEASFEEQLAFVDWELNNTEKRAGDQLRETTTAREAAYIVDKKYERSAGWHTKERMVFADKLMGLDYEKDSPTLASSNVEDMPVSTPSDQLTPTETQTTAKVSDPTDMLTPTETQTTAKVSDPTDMLTPVTFENTSELVAVEAPIKEDIPTEEPEKGMMPNYFASLDKYAYPTELGDSDYYTPKPERVVLSNQEYNTDSQAMVESFIPVITSTSFIETVAERVGEFFGYKNVNEIPESLETKESGLYNNTEFANPADLYMQGRYIDGVSTENQELQQTANLGIVNSPTTVVSSSSNSTTAVSAKMPVRNDKGSFSDLNARNSYW